MLLVRTELKSAGIKGLGIFAKDQIKSGTKVWERDKIFCLSFSLEDYQALTEIQKEFFDHYGVREKNGEYTLDVDNTRFINHSDLPNVSFNDDFGIAIHDIEQGEELTCNYGEIYIQHHLISSKNNS